MVFNRLCFNPFHFDNKLTREPVDRIFNKYFFTRFWLYNEAHYLGPAEKLTISTISESYNENSKSLCKVFVKLYHFSLHLHKVDKIESRRDFL